MTTTSLNYIEFSSLDMGASKTFFSHVFGWEFTDYGADYTAFSRASAGLDGGIRPGEKVQVASQGAPLMVFYTEQLGAMQTQVESAGGKITMPIFSFPGGRRFHFLEPGGNELAVWSDKDA